MTIPLQPPSYPVTNERPSLGESFAAISVRCGLLLLALVVAICCARVMMLLLLLRLLRRLHL